MFKFVSKTTSNENESALFYNGQKICSVFAAVYYEGDIMIQIEDGSGKLMVEWEDYEEDCDRVAD